MILQIRRNNTVELAGFYCRQHSTTLAIIVQWLMGQRCTVDLMLDFCRSGSITLLLHLFLYCFSDWWHFDIKVGYCTQGQFVYLRCSWCGWCWVSLKTSMGVTGNIYLYSVMYDIELMYFVVIYEYYYVRHSVKFSTHVRRSPFNVYLFCSLIYCDITVTGKLFKMRLTWQIRNLLVQWLQRSFRWRT